MSVGTARPTLREIDQDVLRRSDIITVDTRHRVFTEAGDCVVAKSWLEPERAIELAELVYGKASGRTTDQQITLFKSVGSGVQDIALAVKIYQNARAKGLGEKLTAFRLLPTSRRRTFDTEKSPDLFENRIRRDDSAQMLTGLHAFAIVVANLFNLSRRSRLRTGPS
jgi:hypothetical protein